MLGACDNQVALGVNDLCLSGLRHGQHSYSGSGRGQGYMLSW